MPNTDKVESVADENLTFGQNLAKLRKKAKLSIEEAALACGFTTTNWVAMENDMAYPAGRLIRVIANALGVKPYEVL